MAQPTFRPNDEVSPILQTLREAELGWIAEEIELSIRRGKLKEITYSEQGTRRTRKTGYKTVPYDDHEQLELTLKTLKNYFIVLYDISAIVEEELPELLGDSRLNIQINDPDTDEPLQTFMTGYTEQRLRLEILIREALSDVMSWGLRTE